MNTASFASSSTETSLDTFSQLFVDFDSAYVSTYTSFTKYSLFPLGQDYYNALSAAILADEKIYEFYYQNSFSQLVISVYDSDIVPLGSYVVKVSKPQNVPISVYSYFQYTIFWWCSTDFSTTLVIGDENFEIQTIQVQNIWSNVLNQYFFEGVNYLVTPIYTGQIQTVNLQLRRQR
jgi:hypothetical protein